jgi:glyoxylase-like metal-dependent hydrolase (beta-lactamase superfamily II)
MARGEIRQQTVWIMNIKTYVNRIPDKWIIKNSFLDHNPNLSYLITYGSKHAQSILIDANVGIEELTRDLNQLDSKLEWILLTHTHLDHNFRLPEIIAQYPNLHVGIHSAGWKNTFPDIPADHFMELSGNREILVGKNVLTALPTPGHTIDALCFWDKKNRIFFAGDLIMGGEIGCCDYMSGGNKNDFFATLVNLLQLLPDETRIFPGHRLHHYSEPPPYLWSREKSSNPYLKYAAVGQRSKFNEALESLSGEYDPDNRQLF